MSGVGFQRRQALGGGLLEGDFEGFDGEGEGRVGGELGEEGREAGFGEVDDCGFGAGGVHFSLSCWGCTHSEMERRVVGLRTPNMKN